MSRSAGVLPLRGEGRHIVPPRKINDKLTRREMLGIMGRAWH